MIPQDVLPDWCKPSGYPRWPYEVHTTLTYQLRPQPRACSIYSLTPSQVLATLRRDGTLSIHPGYCFGGAMLAPDVPALFRAQVLHDLLSQCCEYPDFPIDRSDVDNYFLAEAVRDGAPLAHVYPIGTRACGWVRSMVYPTRPDEGINIDFEDYEDVPGSDKPDTELPGKRYW